MSDKDHVVSRSMVVEGRSSRSWRCTRRLSLALLLAASLPLVAPTTQTSAGEFFEPVLDINTRTESSMVSELYLHDEQLLFTAKQREIWRLWSADLATSTVTLLADVRVVNPDSFGPDRGPSFVEMDGVLFFVGETPETGAELWRTDGTSDGTFLVADIFPGEESSDPETLTVFDDMLYLSATDDSDPYPQVWITDGTEAGTMVSAALEDATDNRMWEVVVSDGMLYFTSWSGSPSIFATDGSKAGTEFIAWFPTGDFYRGIGLTPHAAGVVFAIENPFESVGDELWYSDGSAGGTYAIDVNPGSASSDPTVWFEHDGWVYFSADDGTSGRELWRFNVLEGVSEMVADIFSGGSSSNPHTQILHEDHIYFAATSVGIGEQLWRTDGTTAGTELVADLGVWSYSAPRSLSRALGELFFTASAFGSGSLGIFRTDDGPDGAVLLAEFDYAEEASLRSPFIEFDGWAYFVVDLDSTGEELWRTDGSAENTELLEIHEARQGASPKPLVVTDSHLFFAANDFLYGRELWAVPAGESAPELYADIEAQTREGATRLLGRSSTHIFFAGNTGEFGTDLWRSDGTAAGTELIADTSPDASSSDPRNAVMFDSRLVFNAVTHIAGEYAGIEPWCSDGTEDGTFLLADIWLGQSESAPEEFTEFDGALFFRAETLLEGRELWRTDLTAAGTELFMDLRPGAEESIPHYFSAQGETMLFACLPATGTSELWTLSKGSLRPALIESAPMFSMYLPGPFHPHDGQWLFSAFSVNNGWELWVTNGMVDGTELLLDIRTGEDADGDAASSAPSYFASYEDMVLFRARDDTGEMGVWRTDGTVAGTKLVAHVPMVAWYSSRPGFQVFDGRAYFAARTIDGEYQLWRTDGTESGTELVKQIGPSTSDRPPSRFTEYHGRMYFGASTPETGFELWATDGTEDGTQLVEDSYPGPIGNDFMEITVHEDRLYALIRTDVVGKELHVLVQRSEFLRGDADGDGDVDPIEDFFFIARWRFLDGPTPRCFDAADCDGNDEVGTLIDALYLLRWGFLGGTAPPDPGPYDCGGDADGDDYPGCAYPSAGCD